MSALSAKSRRPVHRHISGEVTAEESLQTIAATVASNITAQTETAVLNEKRRLLHPIVDIRDIQRHSSMIAGMGIPTCALPPNARTHGLGLLTSTMSLGAGPRTYDRVPDFDEGPSWM
jgi:hypothetical protein